MPGRTRLFRRSVKPCGVSEDAALGDSRYAMSSELVWKRLSVLASPVNFEPGIVWPEPLPVWNDRSVGESTSAAFQFHPVRVTRKEGRGTARAGSSWD